MVFGLVMVCLGFIMSLGVGSFMVVDLLFMMVFSLVVSLVIGGGLLDGKYEMFKLLLRLMVVICVVFLGLNLLMMLCSRLMIWCVVSLKLFMLKICELMWLCSLIRCR